jgi:hypothetical protein
VTYGFSEETSSIKLTLAALSAVAARPMGDPAAVNIQERARR